jgi:ABC-type phosphate transport system substrate-binding protein
MKTFLRILVFATLVAAGTSTGFAQTVVIANTSVPSSSLSVKELMDVYTLNKTHWDDGSRVTVFDMKNGKAKNAFYQYIGMTEDDLQRIWLRKQFTGKARPPRSLSDEEELVELVGRTAGGIGYVSEKSTVGKRNIRIVARVR